MSSIYSRLIYKTDQNVRYVEIEMKGKNEYTNIIIG